MAAETRSLLLDLPEELLRSVARFLSLRDAMSMAQTNRKIRTLLEIVHHERRAFGAFSRDGAYDTGDRWYCWIEIPVSPDHQVHSLSLECIWRDQGWGNRKGECRIIGFPASKSAEIPDQSPEGGRIVASSSVALHREEKLTLTFYPVNDEVYHLWYKVGGGGGHKLKIRDGKLHTVIFGGGSLSDMEDDTLHSESTDWNEEDEPENWDEDEDWDED